MRWLPVIDAAGRTRMEATWVPVPAAGAPDLAAGGHPRRLSGTQLHHSDGRAHRARPSGIFLETGSPRVGIEADHGPLWVIEG